MEVVKAAYGDAATIARILVSSWQTAYRGIMPDEMLANLSIQQREQVWKTHLSSGGDSCQL